MRAWKTGLVNDLHCMAFVLVMLWGFPGAVVAEKQERPNVVLILADDLGFTDLGAFGGEISTPSLDQLANSGIRFSNFHMLPTCQPTRASLLTGADNHVAGMGSHNGLLTDNQKGQVGYELRITDRVSSVIRQLQFSGYQTFMSGKWDLGSAREDWPDQKGFDHWFVLLEGGGSHLDPSGISPAFPVATYIDQGERVSIPEDFYSSDYFTSRLIEYLRKQRDPGRPFFAYLSFTAPHWPLHARQEDMDRYKGKYDSGYDQLRQQRIAGAKSAGVVPADIKVAEPEAGFAPWNTLDAGQRAIEARKMEVYAAMVDRLDWNVGQLMEFLKQSREAENTIVIFASDNGAEGHEMEKYPAFETWIANNYDNRLENIGHKGSYTATGPGWAHASTGPFRMYKGFMSEGGTRVPAIVHWPNGTAAGSTINAYASVADIAPTLLEWAGLERAGQDTLRGLSMVSLLQGKAEQLYPDDQSVSWELLGRRAVYRGQWKLLWLPQPYGIDDWELFNIHSDPGESNNLAAEYPETRDALAKDWQDYADRVGIILPNRALPY